MRKYIIMFVIISIISGVLGFGLMAGVAAVIAKVCFIISLVLLAASLLYDPARRRSEI
jgi:uncharacterized membrane protein YtjA (UPF0391 family)